MTVDILSLIIFGVCIAFFIWDRFPMALTAIAGCVVMVLCETADFSTVFGQFVNSAVVLLVCVMIIGAAFAETGMAAKIGGLLTRLTSGNERLLIAAAYILAALLSSFMTNATVLAIFIPIALGICRDNKKFNLLNIIMPVTLACTIGGTSTLVGSSQQMTAQGLLEEIGLGFGIFEFTPVGAILCLLGLLYSLFIGYPIGKKIWGGRACEYEGEDIKKPREYKKSKQIIISVLFVLMIAGYVSEIVKPHITALIIAILCVGTGCIEQKNAFSKINWNIVGRLAGCLGIAKAVDAAGGIEILSNLVTKVIKPDFSPLALFIIAVVFCQLTSLVMSNSTAIMITLPIIISIAPSMNLNAQSFALGITIASGIGASCPLSSSTWGMSMAVGYKFRDYFKYGALFDLLGLVTVIIFVPLLCGLTN